MRAQDYSVLHTSPTPNQRAEPPSCENVRWLFTLRRVGPSRRQLPRRVRRLHSQGAHPTQLTERAPLRYVLNQHARQIIVYWPPSRNKRPWYVSTPNTYKTHAGVVRQLRCARPRSALAAQLRIIHDQFRLAYLRLAISIRLSARLSSLILQAMPTAGPNAGANGQTTIRRQQGSTLISYRCCRLSGPTRAPTGGLS